MQQMCSVLRLAVYKCVLISSYRLLTTVPHDLTDLAQQALVPVTHMQLGNNKREQKHVLQTSSTVTISEASSAEN